MEISLKTGLALVACLRCAAAEEAGWLEIAAEPAAWSDALLVANPQRAALVLDAPAQTQLRGFIPAAPVPRVLSAKEMCRQVADFLEIAPRQEEVGLKIDWLDKIEVTGFTRFMNSQDARVRSVHQAGRTTITRTVTSGEDAIYVHLIADQPGALSFRVTLIGPRDSEVRIEDRRQLILPADAGGLAGHVWVLPFESDVAAEGRSITVRGEGEALIVWNFAAGRPIDATWSKLGERYDPGHVPPDPTKIWQGVLESVRKSPENSP